MIANNNRIYIENRVLQIDKLHRSLLSKAIECLTATKYSVAKVLRVYGFHRLLFHLAPFNTYRGIMFYLVLDAYVIAQN